MAEKVLYLRRNVIEEENEDFDWDDSLLVKAYDSAVTLAKEKVAAQLAAEEEGEVKQNGIDNTQDLKSKTANTRLPKWKVGNNCRAVYSFDDCEYEAVIKKLNSEEGTCTVKYIGYGNEEEVELRSLRPSNGKEAIYGQKLMAQSQNEGAQDSRSFNQQRFFSESLPNYQQNTPGVVIPPPPPPFVMSNMPTDETDALSAMLMSWYMSGYHTGYYQGLTRSKPAEHPRNFHNGH